MPQIGTNQDAHAKKQDTAPLPLPLPRLRRRAARFLHLSLIACLIQPLVWLERGPVELNDWTPIFFKTDDPMSPSLAQGAKLPARTTCVSRVANAAEKWPTPQRGSNPAGRDGRNGVPT